MSGIIKGIGAVGWAQPDAVEHNFKQRITIREESIGMKVVEDMPGKGSGWRPVALSIYGQLLASLENSEPERALEMTVKRATQEGYQRELILLELEIIGSQLGKLNRETQEDAVRGIMDRMTRFDTPNQML